MREIKFRAWDGKTMYYKVNMLSNWGAIKEGYSATAWTAEAKAGLPMQFIGLKDKNGVEIYEDDIVKLYCGEFLERIEIHKIIFSEGRFVLYRKRPNSNQYTVGEFSDIYLLTGRLEVIGNNFENPELLED